MASPFDIIESTGILPVIKIEEPETAVELAAAIRAGGINAIEVTVRNDSALESLARIKAAFPDMMAGAGTVTNVGMVKAACGAGADFIVSPGFGKEMVEYCLADGIPVTPGCATPSEIQAAQELGLRVVKLFPANRCGGVGAIKDLSGPFGRMKFVPTCGINYDNLSEYLSCPAVAAVGGSFMAKADVIARHDWQTVTDNCRRAVELSLGFELAHVGMNCAGRDEAAALADELNRRFPMGVRPGGKSTFVGTAVELMHIPYYGTHGHIGFRTNSVARAKAYFESHGIAINAESIGYDAKGQMNFFYLADEVGGFALHVVGK